MFADKFAMPLPPVDRMPNDINCVVDLKDGLTSIIDM